MGMHDPKMSPEMLHQATIVSLWKRKGSPGDLNNHLGIFFISLWRRVLGRNVAARLARYAEQQGILDTTQWGFREARSTHGAPAVARRVLNAASKPFFSQVLDPCCVEPLDLKKAHPNSSRNAFHTVMRHFGASEGILRVIQSLIQLTQYTCRAGKSSANLSPCSEVSRKVALLPRLSSISCKKVLCARGDRRWLNMVPRVS